VPCSAHRDRGPALLDAQSDDASCGPPGAGWVDVAMSRKEQTKAGGCRNLPWGSNGALLAERGPWAMWKGSSSSVGLAASLGSRRRWGSVPGEARCGRVSSAEE
jgi:hypothetical protein